MFGSYECNQDYWNFEKCQNQNKGEIVKHQIGEKDNQSCEWNEFNNINQTQNVESKHELWINVQTHLITT